MAWRTLILPSHQSRRIFFCNWPRHQTRSVLQSLARLLQCNYFGSVADSASYLCIRVCASLVRYVLVWWWNLHIV